MGRVRADAVAILVPLGWTAIPIPPGQGCCSRPRTGPLPGAEVVINQILSVQETRADTTVHSGGRKNLPSGLRRKNYRQKKSFLIL
jgi:hypothetical protein